MYIHITHTHAHIYEMYVSISTQVPATAHTSCLVMFGSNDNFLPFYLSSSRDQTGWQTCLINIFIH